MSLRKIAVLLAAGGLAVGLIGGGVGAQFTDQVQALQGIQVGTFSCVISDGGGGVISADKHSVTYGTFNITSSTAASDPINFTVQNTGSIGDVLTVSTTPMSAPFSIIGMPFAAVPLAPSATHTYNTGVQWTELNDSNLGQTGSVTWTVNCGEQAAVPAFNVGYFETNGNADSPFHRYSSPQASVSLGAGNGTASQVVNADGSVTLSISGVTGYGDTGFYVPMGQLGSLPTYTIVASGYVGTNLYLDTDGNGIFGSWTGDTWAGLAGDSYCHGDTFGTTLTVDGTFPFGCSGGISGDYTVAQLQGLLPDAQAWAWIGINGNESATITAAP